MKTITIYKSKVYDDFNYAMALAAIEGSRNKIRLATIDGNWLEFDRDDAGVFFLKNDEEKIYLDICWEFDEYGCPIYGDVFLNGIEVKKIGFSKSMLEDIDYQVDTWVSSQESCTYVPDCMELKHFNVNKQ